ncbi:MAG: hypothetical protein V1690_02715 [Candidatus Moraniibacteriota bacterium]
MDILKKRTKYNVRAIDRNKEKKIFPHTAKGEIKMSWETEEFSYYEKSRIWFLVGGAVFLLIIGYFTITSQLITALTFLLLGVTVYIFSLKKPRNIACSITYQGITVDKVTYPFSDLNSFWIFYEPPDFKVISLKHKKPYLPLIQIPIGEVDPMRVRQTLLELLPEEEQEEPFSDKLARYLRF